MTDHTPFSGTAHALPVVSRRALLDAAPAALIAASAPAMVSTSPDLLPGLLAQRGAAEAAWLATTDGTEAAEAVWTEFRQLEDLIERTVAHTPEGVTAQIQYLKLSYGDPYLVPPLEEQCRVSDVPYTLLDVILAGLGRIGQ